MLFPFLCFRPTKTGAFVCVFATDAIERFLQSLPMSTLYTANTSLPADVIASARQEIGKVACRLLDSHTADAANTRDVAR